MDFSNDDHFDDDDDFIALTLKPPPRSTQAQPILQTQDPQNNKINATIPTSIDNPPNASNDILVAKGEIAVLRSKINELERLKNLEREELLQSNKTEKDASDSKIKALENAVKRLEDERKFLSVEIKNLSHLRKKRKTSEPDTQQAPQSSTSTTEPSTFQQPPAPPAQVLQEQMSRPKPKQVKITQVKQTSENSLFIQSLLSHTIPSCPRSTIDYLSHISLSEPFQSPNDPLFNVPQHTPLSTVITTYLVNKQPTTRLDNLITSLCSNLTLLIQHIVQRKQQSHVSLPFLISLIHSAINFRPVAIVSSTRVNLAKFVIDLIREYGHVVKQNEDMDDNAGFNKRFKIGVVQRRVIDGLIYQFSVELIESLVLTDTEEDSDGNKTLGKLSKEIGAVVKQGFASGCIGVMYSVVEILNVCGRFDKIVDDLMVSLVKVIHDGCTGESDLEFSGMNRMFGDETEAWRLIDGLVLVDGVSDIQQVVYTRGELNYDNLEIRVMNLQLLICEFLEGLLINSNDSSSNVDIFIKDPMILKLLISSIGEQQEYIFKSPRSKTTHLRSKLISSLINLIHLIWELTYAQSKTTPRITKDTTHKLIITLSRIAFSANITVNEATEFLYLFRKFDKDAIVFNKYSESRARELSHVDHHGNRGDDLNSIVNAEVGMSNGVEFAYDDFVVELARDILEKCTTMDEADNLYLSMNA